MLYMPAFHFIDRDAIIEAEAMPYIDDILFSGFSRFSTFHATLFSRLLPYETLFIDIHWIWIWDNMKMDEEHYFRLPFCPYNKILLFIIFRCFSWGRDIHRRRQIFSFIRAFFMPLLLTFSMPSPCLFLFFFVDITRHDAFSIFFIFARRYFPIMPLYFLFVRYTCWWWWCPMIFRARWCLCHFRLLEHDDRWIRISCSFFIFFSSIYFRFSPRLYFFSFSFFDYYVSPTTYFSLLNIWYITCHFLFRPPCFLLSLRYTPSPLFHIIDIFLLREMMRCRYFHRLPPSYFDRWFG